MPDHTINLKEKEAERPIRRRKPAKLAIFAVVAVGALYYMWSLAAGAAAWRAVFLANNQVYFGHFWDIPFSSAITLRDVYYLQISQLGAQLSGQDRSQLKLIKLGNEIHGPTSEMVIPFSQVLFWETLRSDSAIVKTIQNGQAQASQ